jgi:hypothetical protein
MRYYSFFLFPCLCFASLSKNIDVGLTAVQQIRTLVPERLLDEEFAIWVDSSAFPKRTEGAKGCETMLSSKYYLSYWTIAGEPIRLLDSYQQFEYGPFWFYPTAMQKLTSESNEPVSEGVLVADAKMGIIGIKGNEYSLPSEILEEIQMKEGEPFNARYLMQDLARMNENPFRRTDAILKPGKKPGAIDVELETSDRWPYRFYTGADNSGTRQTDRDRFFLGFNFGKTIVKDTELSYQFTCAPNWNRFIAHTAFCKVPFPARQMFIFYGGFTQARPEVGSDVHQKTRSWQVDGRYRIPILTNNNFLQEFLLGYDYKQVLISEKSSDVANRFHNHVDVNQFMIGYDLGYRTKYTKVTLVGEFYGNPGGITQGNHNHKYEAFRAGSYCQYAYFKLSHSFAHQFLSGTWLTYNLNGQLATSALLPSEQFTLAGYQAVRGFEERAVNVDNALLFNLELQSPRVSIGKSTGLSKKNFDEFYLLLFFDCGYGSNYQTPVGESATRSLASIGPGARYQIDRYLTARFDYGVQLFHHGFENPSHSRYNFGLIVSF